MCVVEDDAVPLGVVDHLAAVLVLALMRMMYALSNGM